MRRISLLAVVASLFVGVLAVPAMAVEPVRFVETVSFPDTNICTGEAHTVNITNTVDIRENRNSVVGTVKTEVWTGDGWTGGGSEAFVENSKVFTDTQNLIVRDGNGGAYKVQFRLKIDLDSGDVRFVLDIDCKS
jgi:hypothetical protein